MGVRGELFSTRIILPNRTYFFNVKENRMGDLYLNIVESKNKETGGFDRQSVILFADDLQQFLKGFDESLKVMEKAVREKRHGASGGRDEKRHGAPGGRDEKHFRKERPDRGHEEKRHGASGNREGKTRVVVRNKKDNKSQDFSKRNKEGKGSYRPKAMREFHDKTTDKNP